MLLVKPTCSHIALFSVLPVLVHHSHRAERARWGEKGRGAKKTAKEQNIWCFDTAEKPEKQRGGAFEKQVRLAGFVWEITAEVAVQRKGDSKGKKMSVWR